jgi:Ca-activated chloride channel family protein
MKLDNLVPTLSNPGALGSILGGVMGNKQQGTNGQPAQKQDTVGQILGALGGKQPQQQQQGQQPAQGQQQPQQGQSQPQQQTGATPQQQQNKPQSWSDIVQGALGQKKQQQPASTQPQDQQQQQQQQKPKDYSEQPPEQPK